MYYANSKLTVNIKMVGILIVISGKNGTSKNGTGNNGTNGKVGNNGTIMFDLPEPKPQAQTYKTKLPFQPQY